VIRPEIDQMPGACREWYCAQHFVTVSDGSAAVAWTALDSPLVTLQDIYRGQSREHLDLENGALLAYVFNNYWWTNYKASQGGRFMFRFSMTSAKSISDVEAKQFGESVQSPMIAGCPSVIGKKPAAQRSFIKLAASSVVLQSLAPARFASGVVLTLREMGGRTVTSRVAITGIPFRRAYLCNLAEDRLRELKVSSGSIQVPCVKLGLTTVLLSGR
jgi:hypothetical protein